jgi:hypothetical protein
MPGLVLDWRRVVRTTSPSYQVHDGRLNDYRRMLMNDWWRKKDKGRAEMLRSTSGSASSASLEGMADRRSLVLVYREGESRARPSEMCAPDLAALPYAVAGAERVCRPCRAGGGPDEHGAPQPRTAHSTATHRSSSISHHIASDRAPFPDDCFVPDAASDGAPFPNDGAAPDAASANTP